jgi:hypothetical protein
MSTAPRYIPSVSKALEVALWIARDQPHIDIYHMVKAAFYADKYHLNEYGRPIVGDEYEAAWFGPLPQVLYKLVRHEPMEMLALGNQGPLPISMDDKNCVVAERDPNLGSLSESDIDALGKGVDHVKGKTFKQLFNETHADPAYFKAKGGRMDYREFLSEDDPQKIEKAEMLSEVAPYAVFDRLS